MVDGPPAAPTGDVVPAAAAAQLCRRCNAGALDFQTTSDLDGTAIDLGQARALEALDFGSRIARSGYNLFVMGPAGSAARDIVGQRLEAKASHEALPSDWVYVNNFDTANKPIALELPPGRAVELRDSMAELIDDLSAALPAVFESEDYRNRRESVDEDFQGGQEEAFKALGEKARERGAAILRTPMGFAVAPLKDGKVVKPEEFEGLPESEQKAMQETIADIQNDLQELMRAAPKLEKERREAIRKIDRETAMVAVGQSIDAVRDRFPDLPDVLAYIEAARTALVEQASLFLVAEADGQGGIPTPGRPDGRFDAFTVNVLVSHPKGSGAAPVVHEDHPTLPNLVGRIEHVAHQGALITNFSLIKPGALHRANGGYLMLDARQLLSEAFAWPALKRVLRAGCIRIVNPGEYLGLATTVSLEPDPIPLNVKVVIFGERMHYYLLLALDPDMRELFKVVADFEDAVDWTAESERDFARFLGALCTRDGLLPLDTSAVARMVEHAARQAGDARKLSLEVEPLADRLRESDFIARKDGRLLVTGDDVERAIQSEIRRIDRVRDQAQESILRDIALVDTDGEAVGQINGLSVSQIGSFRFGRPTRITARVRAGTGKVVDIEREVELGGPLHSKGVLILSGFLAARYALDLPMSLAATLVFEQSYGGVDGDSASCAELYALLSALSGLPLRQSLAVTGSVNQHGEVQAIGGANEKIEGFFDICQARGLTGDQGVLIPQSNMQHLMLRDDVVEACEAGRFAVYAITTIDQGIALLTGVGAGDRQADGRFPEGTVNRRAEDRLVEFAETRQRFARGAQEDRVS